MRVAILDDYLGCAREVADWSAVESQAEIVVFEHAFISPEETVAALRDFDAICLMRDRTPLSAQTLAQLPKLRYITFTGARNLTLDVEAAKAAGITVCFTPTNSIEPTIELVWALIMALVRHIPANDASLRAGRWQSRVGMTLSGATLGVVGLARIGAPIAKIAQTFGMRVLAWSPRLTEEVAAAAGAERVDFDRLLTESDIVTLHVALNDGTRGLIGRRELELIGPDAYLVNTSRGPIVDEAALVAALLAGTIAGAGLDVYDQEPLPAGHPLIAAPNTVLLPHLGFITKDRLAVFYQETVENVLAWLAGAPIHTL